MNLKIITSQRSQTQKLYVTDSHVMKALEKETP
jgi:hypothetical protein